MGSDSILGGRPTGGTPKRRRFVRRWARFGVPVAVAVGLYLVADQVRRGRPAEQYRREIEALRVTGMPVRPADLAAWFPPLPPERDFVAFLTRLVPTYDPRSDSLEGVPPPGGTTSYQVLKSGQARRGWTPGDWAVCEAECRSNAPVIDVFLAQDLAGFGVPYAFRDGPAGLPPQPGDSAFLRLDIARGLAVFAAHEAEPGAGRPSQAVVALERGYQVAAIRSPSGIYGCVARQACESILMPALVQVLNRASLGDAELVRLSRALDRPPGVLEEAMRVERVWMLSRGAIDPVPASAADSTKGLEASWLRFIVGIRGFGSRLRLLEAVNAELASMRGPLSRRLELARHHDADALAQATHRWPRFRAMFDADFWIAPSMINLRHQLYERDAAIEAFHLSAQVVIAVERWRRAHGGRIPAALAELGLEWLPAVPADPCDGRPFRYRRTNGGYQVYSVGPDGKDDGGLTGPWGEFEGVDVGIGIER